MALPNDPIILLSYVNTQLRDNYSSLDDFCKSLDVNESDLLNKLKAIQYEYNPNRNQFV